MKNLSFMSRPKTPSRVFKSSFEAAVYDFSAEFLRSSAFQHALSKGEEREGSVKNFLLKHLPQAFGIAKGEVIDVDGRRSPQLDLMIFDKFRNFAFYSGDASILPAEALLVSIEVKSTLNSGELGKILRAAQILHRLRPFRVRLTGPRRAGQPADDHARFFHCVFAYNSDLAESNWLQNEQDRFASAASKLSIPVSVVSRIYVANRGLINPSESRGLTEEKNEGTALMQFYMHILNFLSRENDRRKPVPYIEYAGRMTKGWRSLEHKAKSTDGL